MASSDIHGPRTRKPYEVFSDVGVNSPETKKSENTESVTVFPRNELSLQPSRAEGVTQLAMMV